MVRCMIVILVCCVMLLTVSMSAQAEWWNDPKIKQSVGLSDKQVEAMNKIFTSFKEKRNETGNKFRTTQKQLSAMLAEEKLDEAKVRKSMDEAALLHSQTFKDMCSMKLEVRKLLTPEQLKKLLAEQPQIFSANRLWMARGSRAMRQKSMMKKGNEPMVEKGGDMGMPGQQTQSPVAPAPTAPSSDEGSKK